MAQNGPLPGQYQFTYAYQFSGAFAMGFVRLDVKYTSSGLDADKNTILGDNDIVFTANEARVLMPDPVSNAAGKAKHFPIYAPMLSSLGDADPTSSRITVGGAAYVSSTAGDAIVFVVECRNELQQRITTSGALGYLSLTFTDAAGKVALNLVASALSPTTALVGTSSIVDSGKGLYTITVPAYPPALSLTVAGTYTLTIVGTPKAGSTQKAFLGYDPSSSVTIVPRPTSAARSTLLDPRGADVTIPATGLVYSAGVTVDVKVNAYDEFDNFQLVNYTSFIGGDSFAGRVIRPKGGPDSDVTSSYTNVKDSSYRLKSTHTLAAPYQIFVTLGSVAVTGRGLFPLDSLTGKPYIPLTVLPGPRDNSKCVVQGPGLTAGTKDPDVDTAQVLSIYEKDTYGNDLLYTISSISGGTPDYFIISFTPIQKPALAFVFPYTLSADKLAVQKAAGTAIHQVNYVAGRNPRTPDAPPVAGKFRLYVSGSTAGNTLVPILGSPFGLTIIPGALSLATSYAYGPGLNNLNINDATVRAGVPINVTFQGCDVNGNNLVGGGETTLQLTLNPFPPAFLGKMVLATTVDNGDGTYTFSYVAQSNGLLLLQIARGSTDVLPTSQFKVGLCSSSPPSPALFSPPLSRLAGMRCASMLGPK